MSTKYVARDCTLDRYRWRSPVKPRISLASGLTLTPLTHETDEEKLADAKIAGQWLSSLYRDGVSSQDHLTRNMYTDRPYEIMYLSPGNSTNTGLTLFIT